MSDPLTEKELHHLSAIAGSDRFSPTEGYNLIRLLREHASLGDALSKAERKCDIRCANIAEPLAEEIVGLRLALAEQGHADRRYVASLEEERSKLLVQRDEVGASLSEMKRLAKKVVDAWDYMTSGKVTQPSARRRVDHAIDGLRLKGSDDDE